MAKKYKLKEGAPDVDIYFGKHKINLLSANNRQLGILYNRGIYTDLIELLDATAEEN